MVLSLRAEHSSIESFLVDNLSNDERRHPLMISFNQWDFALEAFADIALAFQEVGADLTLGFWSGKTPIRDMGWSTNHRIAQLFMSSARDSQTRSALLRAGIDRRCIVDPPIKRWKAREAFGVERAMCRSEIRELKYRGSEMGRAILQVHPDNETPITDDFLWAQGWLQSAAESYSWTFDQVQEVIRQRRISSVIVYNGRFMHDRAAAAAAESLGVPVLYYDTGGKETNYDFTRAQTHDWADLQERMRSLYEIWNPEDRDIVGSRWFQDRMNHVDPSNLVFVDGQELGASIDLPDSSRVVVFFSSSGDEIVELDIDWSEYFQGQGQALRELASVCSELGDCFLVVRSHPHKRLKPKRDLEDWLSDVEAASPDVHLGPESSIDSYTLMRQADVVVTYGSTTGVEAAFAGVPVIVMGPSAYDLIGSANRVRNREQLKNALLKPCSPSHEGTLSWGLLMMRRGFNFSYVEIADDGSRSIAGETLGDANNVSKVVSDALNRYRVRRLTRN